MQPAQSPLTVFSDEDLQFSEPPLYAGIQHGKFMHDVTLGEKFEAVMQHEDVFPGAVLKRRGAL